MEQIRREQVAPTWSPIDHDLLIEMRTTLQILSSDVKIYNMNNSALELRVRALENINNKYLGGWRTILVIFGAFAGLAGLIVSYLAYFSHSMIK